MLLQSKNIFYQIAHNQIEISSIYLWVLIAVATVLFIYFLLKTNKKPEAIDETTIAQNNDSAHREISEEEAAAIAMALSLYKSKVQLKSTLQRVPKAYSPWNSKIYMLRQNPRN